MNRYWNPHIGLYRGEKRFRHDLLVLSASRDRRRIVFHLGDEITLTAHVRQGSALPDLDHDPRDMPEKERNALPLLFLRSHFKEALLDHLSESGVMTVGDLRACVTDRGRNRIYHPENGRMVRIPQIGHQGIQTLNLFLRDVISVDILRTSSFE